jgi:hypothetical protein
VDAHEHDTAAALSMVKGMPLSCAAVRRIAKPR